MISRAVKSVKIETSVDVTKDAIGNVDDPKFFENNFGEGKAFPG